MEILQRQWIFVRTAGDSAEELASLGFRPVFLDCATMTIYPSRFADGQPAPLHVLDGLPLEAVSIRSPCGRVIAPKATLVRGYERNGFFYTRRAARRAAKEWARFI
jgi:hypothetical protein